MAEDEPEILRLYKILLEAEGHQVIATTSGEECLDVYNKELQKVTNRPLFDLVMLDQMMSNKSGAQVAREILELRPNQRLLMITADPDHPDLQDKNLRNKMRIIQKPIEVEDLLRLLAEIKEDTL